MIALVWKIASAACVVVGGSVLVCTPASAKPLIPLEPHEVRYLEHLRQVFSLARDRAEFRGDGELLELGHYVCAQKAVGSLGSPTNLVSPIINQIAVIDLCPN